MNHIKWSLIVLILFSVFPWSVEAGSALKSNLVLKLQDGVTVEDFLLANNLKENQIKVGRNSYVLVNYDSSQAEVLAVKDWKKISRVEQDGQATILNTVPNDPYYNDPNTDQWYLKKIGMEKVWDNYKGTDQVVVAVIDTGLNYRHEDMGNLIWANSKEIANNGVDDDKNGYVDDYNGWNFINSTPNIDDDNDHGTAVSSVIAANTNNKIGMAGVCWKAKIMPLKVANAGGSASLFDIAQAIYYAVDNGAKVVNLSLGATIDQSDVKDAVDYAFKKGVVLVAAAGNSEVSGPGVNHLYYPANYSSVIAVGATDINDEVASLGNSSFISHQGKNLDLVAPGVDILAATSGVAGDKYAKYDGTSMSVPQVVGAAVILWDKNINLTAEEVESALLTSTDKVSDMTGTFDERYGNGRLNVLNALSKVNVKNSIEQDNSVPTNSENDQTVPVNNNSNNQVDNPANFGNKFLAQWVGQSNYWYLKPGEKRKVWVEFKNVGDALWQINGSNAVHLGTDRNYDRSSIFYDQSSWYTSNRVIAKNDVSVKPGEVMRFEFEIQAPSREGVYKEYFSLVAENKQWSNDMGVFWQFTVTNNDIFSSAWVNQSNYLTLKQGMMGESWVDFVNNGTAIWLKEGNNAIHLGTDRAQDRYSSFYDPSTWLAPNRLVLDQVEVKPGEVGRFTFKVFPKSIGVFNEYFRPLVENKMWLPDQGVFLRYTINS